MDYDKSRIVYNPSGEIMQFTYATRAIERSPALVSYFDQRRNARIILAMHYGRMSRLLAAKSRQSRIHQLGRNIVSAHVGYSPDNTATLAHLKEIIHNYELTFGELPGSYYISGKIADWMIRGLFGTGEKKIHRPMATCSLLCSHNNSKIATLVTNTGGIIACDSLFLGKISEGSKKFIQDIISGGGINGNSEQEKIESLAAILERMKEEGYDSCELSIVKMRDGKEVVSPIYFEVSPIDEIIDKIEHIAHQ